MPSVKLSSSCVFFSPFAIPSSSAQPSHLQGGYFPHSLLDFLSDDAFLPMFLLAPGHARARVASHFIFCMYNSSISLVRLSLFYSYNFISGSFNSSNSRQNVRFAASSWHLTKRIRVKIHSFLWFSHDILSRRNLHLSIPFKSLDFIVMQLLSKALVHPNVIQS